MDVLAVSVVIPTLNGQPEIGPVLRAVRRQEVAGGIEIIVVDSGSTDGTREIAGRYADRVIDVEKDAFDHGDTRNLAIAHARAAFVVILSQDAEPVGHRWLASLLEPLVRDDRVAAVCGRLLPRPHTDLLLRRGVEGDLNFATERREVALDNPAAFAALSPYEKRLHLNFHDVGSCVRKSVWETLPFPRTAFGEDLMWAKAAVENGHRLVYEPSAAVLHAHDYSPEDLYVRARLDGWLNRRLLDRKPIERLHHVAIMTARGMRADLRYLADRDVAPSRRVGQLPRSFALQWSTFWGLYRGGRATEHHDVVRRPGPARPLRILFVVHGFPPQDLAGTEVHTWTVAKGLRDRGHHVAVFHRVSAPDRPAYELSQGAFDGLDVHRLVNDFRYAGIEETYENPAVEARFREVLGRERPDVVHFQHCLHTSVSLLSVAEDAGIPTVVTLNDFWFICPTVQFILPNRSLCDVHRAGLGCVRCARNGGKKVRIAQTVVRGLGPIAKLGVRAYRAAVNRWPHLRRDAGQDAVALAARPGAVAKHLRRAGRVIAPSRFLRDRYIAFGLDPDQIIYQRYGIDTARFIHDRATTRSPGPLRVGFIGSFVWYKGLHVLIEAFLGIDADVAQLTIHGNETSPPEVRPYAKQCRADAMGAPIRFGGPLAQEGLAAAHDALDVLVVPSIWYENSPLVILEARASGTPVITSDLGGMAEMVEDRVTGRLFPRGDAGRLRQIVLELAADPPGVARMAAAIRPPKDVPTNVTELELIYRQQVSMPRVGGGCVPFWTTTGQAWTGRRGAVEGQGSDLALLRPTAGGSRVEYAFAAPWAGRVRIVVTTRTFDGEEHVVLAGRLFLNEEMIGEILPHSTAAGQSNTRQHAFTAPVPAGAVSIRLEAGAESTPAFLRIQRIAAFHEHPEQTGC